MFLLELTPYSSSKLFQYLDTPSVRTIRTTFAQSTAMVPKDRIRLEYFDCEYAALQLWHLRYSLSVKLILRRAFRKEAQRARNHQTKRRLWNCSRLSNSMLRIPGSSRFISPCSANNICEEWRSSLANSNAESSLGVDSELLSLITPYSD